MQAYKEITALQHKELPGVGEVEMYNCENSS